MSTPSAQEIQREVATLRDIRRRSSQQGPGSIPLDPDLPPNGVASASAGGYWENYGPQDDAPSGLSVDDDDQVGAIDETGADQGNLFWLPARLHPEIAPAEFRAFLKDHTTTHPDGGPPLSRSASGASSLGRKKSMLSKQYNPDAHDKDEEEKVVSVRRNRSSIYANAGPQLTIGDLQKLEALAEEAANSDDPSKLRSVLRRSLSLNVAPSFIDQMDALPEVDEADNPIIVPRPGQILRRSARTKIRKPGLPGDGGGHRFASTRRSARSAKPDVELTSSDGGHDSDTRASFEKTSEQERPVSYSDEAFILDAYGDRRDSIVSTHSSAEDDEISSQSHSTAPTSAPQSSSHSGGHDKRAISPPVETSLSPPRGQTVRRVETTPEQHHPEPMLHSPVPRGHLDVPPQPANQPSRSPSPTTSEGGRAAGPSTSPDPFRRSPSAPPQAQANETSSPISPSPSSISIRSTKSEKAKEKEKKGLLKGMFGAEKKKEASKEHNAKENNKDGGFLSSLFGGKKKHEEPDNGRGLLSGAGPAAAAALLGASRGKGQYNPPASPTAEQTNNWSRYPIHVERAVYRLSHIKLANPRRPLYEQVLISNLMFWYLGVINKVTPPGGDKAEKDKEKTTTPAVTSGAEGNEGGNKEDKEKAEYDRAERERAEREEKERAEKERVEKEKERERELQREKEKETKKRGALVKAAPPGAPGAQRRAEMPVQGPRYDMQHRSMEQDGYNMPPPQMGRPMPRSQPVANDGHPPSRGDSRGDPYYEPQQQGPPRQRPPYPPHPPHQHPQHPHPPSHQQHPQHHHLPHPPGPPRPSPYSGQQLPPNQPPYPPQQFQQGPPPPPPQNNFMQFAPPLPPGAMPPPPSQPMGPDQWMNPAMGGPPPPGHPGRVMSPPQQGYRGPPPPNGPGSPPPGGARLVGRSQSANAGGPPPMGGPRPPSGPRQGGPPPPMMNGPPMNGPPGPPMNGGWGPPPPHQRRGASPQPPPPGERMRMGSAASADELQQMGWQQPPPQYTPPQRMAR